MTASRRRSSAQRRQTLITFPEDATAAPVAAVNTRAISSSRRLTITNPLIQLDAPSASATAPAALKADRRASRSISFNEPMAVAARQAALVAEREAEAAEAAAAASVPEMDLGDGNANVDDRAADKVTTAANATSTTATTTTSKAAADMTAARRQRRRSTATARAIASTATPSIRVGWLIPLCFFAIGFAVYAFIYAFIDFQKEPNDAYLYVMVVNAVALFFGICALVAFALVRRDKLSERVALFIVTIPFFILAIAQLAIAVDFLVKAHTKNHIDVQSILTWQRFTTEQKVAYQAANDCCGLNTLFDAPIGSCFLKTGVVDGDTGLPIVFGLHKGVVIESALVVNTTRPVDPLLAKQTQAQVYSDLCSKDFKASLKRWYIIAAVAMFIDMVEASILVGAGTWLLYMAQKRAMQAQLAVFHDD